MTMPSARLKHQSRKALCRAGAESVPPERMQALIQCSWPGNIRELERFIERAVILSRGTTLNVPPFESVSAGEKVTSSSANLEKIEREHILRVLLKSKGKIGGPGGAAGGIGDRAL